MIPKLLKLFNFSNPTNSISTEELHKRIAENDSDALILDVRTPEEFLAGHVPKAINIDIRSRDFNKKMLDLDKNKTYFVYCRSGMRSLQACKEMAKAGFKDPINVKGGFLSWMKINA